MDERRMIDGLEQVLEDAGARGLDIGIARSVLGGGEWPLAPIESGVVATEDAIFGARWGANLRTIRESVGDPPDPYRKGAVR